MTLREFINYNYAAENRHLKIFTITIDMLQNKALKHVTMREILKKKARLRLAKKGA